eukprot:5188685-Lingulodinium_polyedra.AAC.1
MPFGARFRDASFGRFEVVPGRMSRASPAIAGHDPKLRSETHDPRRDPSFRSPVCVAVGPRRMPS